MCARSRSTYCTFFTIPGTSWVWRQEVCRNKRAEWRMINDDQWLFEISFIIHIKDSISNWTQYTLNINKPTNMLTLITIQKRHWLHVLTESMTAGLETLSIRCNEMRDEETICTPIMKLHEEPKIIGFGNHCGKFWAWGFSFPNRYAIHHQQSTVLISHQKRIANKKKIFVAGTFYKNFTGLRFCFTWFFLLYTQCRLS